MEVEVKRIEFEIDQMESGCWIPDPRTLNAKLVFTHRSFAVNTVYCRL